MTETTVSDLQPRLVGRVNWRGMLVLTNKEIGRFLKVYTQTVIAPVVTTILYYIVFAFALGGEGRMMGDVPYLHFLAPGLVMMSMAQNAFANTSSSIVIAKVQGNIVDVLMPPLSAFELTTGYTLGGIVRGLAVGGVSALCLLLVMAHMEVASPFYVIYHALMGSMMLALMGILGGLWAEKFDHMAAVQNFIIMPATFLSGTFYRADNLPGGWSLLCHLNPFFYMIDGFRYGFIGKSDGLLHAGLFVMLAVNAALLTLTYKLIAKGYKLKA